MHLELSIFGIVFSSLPGVLGIEKDVCQPENHNPNIENDAGVVWESFEEKDDGRVFQVLDKFQFVKIIDQDRSLNPVAHRNIDDVARSTMWEIMKSARRFRGFLEGKTLDLELAQCRSSSRELSAKVLSGCKIRRCPSIRFNGALAPSCITQYTTGSKQVRDTYREWHHIHENYLPKLPGFDMVIDWNHNYIASAEEAAWQYDSDAFSEHIRIILQKAREWADLEIKQKVHEAVTFTNQVHTLSAALSGDLDHYIKDNFRSGLLDFDLTPEVDLSEYPFPWQWDAEKISNRFSVHATQVVDETDITLP